MADRLAWSPEAIEDIEAIAAYIERDSPHYARVSTRVNSVKNNDAGLVEEITGR